MSNKVVITFANNETLIIEEKDLLIPINPTKGIVSDNKKESAFTSQGIPYEVWEHIHNGFIPSITEFLSQAKFFSTISDDDIVYNSSSVVKITNL